LKQEVPAYALPVRRLLLLPAVFLVACGSSSLSVSSSEVDEWAQQHVRGGPACTGGDCMESQILSSEQRPTAPDDAPLWCFEVRTQQGQQVGEGNLDGYRWTSESTNVECYRFYNDGSGVYALRDNRADAGP
jgi:hypothetical protein